MGAEKEDFPVLKHYNSITEELDLQAQTRLETQDSMHGFDDLVSDSESDDSKPSAGSPASAGSTDKGGWKKGDKITIIRNPKYTGKKGTVVRWIEKGSTWGVKLENKKLISCYPYQITKQRRRLAGSAHDRLSPADQVIKRFHAKQRQNPHIARLDKLL